METMKTVPNSSITDVSWNVYKQDDVVTSDISPEISTKHELLELLSQNELKVPSVNPGEELCIEYYSGSELISISICNYTSDVESEWYNYSLSDKVILKSVMDDRNYVYDYTDQKMRAEVAGSDLTFEEFLKTIS